MEFLRSFQGKIARTHSYWKIFNNARKLGNKNGREVSLMRLNQSFEDSGGKRNGRWSVRKPSLKYYKLV